MAANSSIRDSNSLDEFRHLKAFHVNHVDKVGKGFLQLLELGKHSDVTFIVTEDKQDHRIPAHRVILASQSEYFDRLLFGEMMEAHPGAEIPLQDTPLEAFQLLMKYTYCGEMKIKDSDLQLMFDVVRLADRFGLNTLKSALGDHLGSIACYSNVLSILMHADLFRLEEAKAVCFQLLDTNAQSILNEASQDFLSLPQKYLEDIVGRDSFVCEEINIFQIVRKWLEHKKTKEESASLLKVVRLCEISPKLLFAEVEPSGLFDKEAIFEAMKVSCKPELEHMTPRGFTKPDQNLFESGDNLVLYQYSYSDSPPKWRETGKASTRIKQPHSLHLSGSDDTQPPTSVIINLNGVYLVNNITLELVGFNSMYTVHVSGDNKTWRQLIDYSKTVCTRMQVLWFPKQAVRYIQFAPSRKCTVQLHSCALMSEVPVFAFRDPGVIAPLEPFTPLHLHKRVNSNSVGMAGYVVYFYQPYSFSLLRMTLFRDFDEEDSIDVQVKVHNETYDFKDQRFGEDIEVKFAESFGHRFTVFAKPTEEQTKKRKKLNDSNEWEPADPGTIIGEFRITFVCQAL